MIHGNLHAEKKETYRKKETSRQRENTPNTHAPLSSGFQAVDKAANLKFEDSRQNQNLRVRSLVSPR